MILRRTSLFFAALLFPLLVYAEVIHINQFSGLNTDDNTLALTNGQTPDSENVLTDIGPGIQMRKGFIAYSSEPCTGLWEFPVSDGTRYIIENTGAGNLKADTGDGVFEISVATVPTDRIVVATVLGDKFYFADTLNGLKYWNGTSVVVAASTMTVDNLVTWKGRLAASGKSGSNRTLFISKYLDGTNWNAPVNASDDDAAQITIAGSLDENIIALYASFQDKLMWYKNNSFGGIYGSRRSNFIQRTFSDYIGVSSRDSIRDCDGLLRWLAPNRAVWEFDGASFHKISEDVDVLFATISQGDTASKSNIQTTATHWAAGTSNPSFPVDFTSTIDLPGSLTPKTTTFLDTLITDFSQGTCNPQLNCDTTTISGSLQAKIYSNTETTSLEFGAGTFDNAVYADTQTVTDSLQTTFPDLFSTYRNGDSSTKQVWYDAIGLPETIPFDGGVIRNGQLEVMASEGSGYKPNFFVGTLNPVFIAPTGTTFYVQISSLTTEASALRTFYFVLNNSTRELTSADIHPVIGVNNYFWVEFASTLSNQIKVRTAEANGTTLGSTLSGQFSMPISFQFFITPSTFQFTVNGSSIVKTGSHTWPTTTNIFVHMAYRPSAVFSGQQGFTVDNFSVVPQTFTYTGSFDTDVSTPIWDSFSASMSGSTVTYTTEVSADNSSWDSAIALLSGNRPTSARKRYIRLNAAFVNTSTTSVMQLTDYVLNAHSTSTFTSRTFDTGISTTIWGLFNVTASTTGNGTVSYFTQSSSDGSTWDSRIAISTGAQLTNNKKRYVRYQADLFSTSSTDTVKVDDVTITAKSTGVYTTQTINIGNAITAWGPITINGSDSGGSYTATLSTSTDGVTFSTGVIIYNNLAPIVSTSPYVQVNIKFILDVATDTPQVDDITINWTEGSSIRSASAYFDQRYWLAVALSSTSNNRIFVYDKKHQWQRYNGLNVSATTLYQSSLYFGNPVGIFKAETGYNDNGSDISAYYKTADLFPGSLDTFNLYNYLYVTADNSDSTLSSTFQLDGISTNYSLGDYLMNTQSGIQNAKLPFSQSEIQHGKYINIKWAVSGTSFWRILNGNLYFQPMTYPD